MEVRSFYSVDDNTCLLAGAEQEGPAHNPWSTQGPHPVLQRPKPNDNVDLNVLNRQLENSLDPPSKRTVYKYVVPVSSR